MRGSSYCVIDEVDSILIDEARTPLIISGPADRPSDRYYKAAKIAAAYERDIHYTVRLPSILLMSSFTCDGIWTQCLYHLLLIRSFIRVYCTAEVNHGSFLFI